MVKFILLVAFSATTFADEILSSAVTGISTRFSENKKVLQDCLYERPSQNAALGCVRAFQYMNALCNVTREDDFKIKYKKISKVYFTEACKLYDQAENKTASFFELDEKSCVQGFETIPDRILTLNRNKKLLDDHFAYVYEKTSCKDFRNYVNLCVYIDGALKESMPNGYQQMPKLDFGKTKKNCAADKAGISGVVALETDLSNLAATTDKKVFETLILKYRSRMPSAEHAKSPTCEEVRTSYLHLGCDQFEGFTDGDPVYITEKEMAEKRRQRSNALGNQSTGR